MRIILSGADVFTVNGLQKCDMAIESGRIISFSPEISAGDTVIGAEGLNIFPGFVDVHTHLREPGFFYKETIKSGTKAAARGGFTTVFSMPNLNPCPDCLENLKVQTDIIEKDACIEVVPYASITKGEKGAELSDFETLAPYVGGFSDDGKGVQSALMMEKAMQKASSLGKIIVAHCEDESLLRGGYIHDGVYARQHGHKGICSASEYTQVERDLALAEKTGCRYHICHVSAAESVEAIRQAKKRGVKVTAETCPHYLTLTENDLKEEGRFKMNPPLRTAKDRDSLIEGLKDGTIDVVSTDHAPHSAEEKSKGLKDSLMGVVGLETAFPVLYTELVKKGLIGLEKLIDVMSVNPAKIFGHGSSLEVGSPASFTVFDLNDCYEIDPSEFQSKGKSTPYAGKKVYGRCIYTFSNGRIVWQEKERK